MAGAKKQKETPAQKALADHAQQQLQDYQKRWLPVQKRLAQTIQADGAEGSTARRMAAGRSSTDTAMAFDKVQGAVEKSLSSGGSALKVTGLADDRAKSTGLGAVMSEQAIDDAYTQGLGALTQIGRGEAAQVGSSLSQQAQTSAMQAQADAQAAAMNREGNAAMVGQVAGFGLQQGLGNLGPRNSFTGTNDFKGVTGSNANDMFLRFGKGGD